MTVTTVSLIQPKNNGANNAAIKAWGSAISSMFSGAGLVQTADTGQINWTTTTATYPTSGTSDVEVGYEIWRLNDSLSATKPVVARVGYRVIRNGGTAEVIYYIVMSVATATNGAGALSGSPIGGLVYMTPHNATAGSATGFTGTVSCFSSGDGSYLTLALGPAATAGGGYNTNNTGGLGIFYLDRTRDSAGGITGEGAVFGGVGWGSGGTQGTPGAPLANTGFFGVLSFTTGAIVHTPSGGNGVANTGSILPAYVPTQLSNGSDIAFQSPPVLCNGKLLPPILAALAYNINDVSIGSTVVVPVSGSNRTYYCLGAFTVCADRKVANTSASLALRYE